MVLVNSEVRYPDIDIDCAPESSELPDFPTPILEISD